MKKIFLIITLLIGNLAFATEVTILHTSDVHGRISPVEYKGVKNTGGLSRRVTFFNEIRENNKHVLILDSGDYSQGSIYYRIYFGKASARLLPYAKYDAIALGNHEFDNGEHVLKNIVKKSKTQYISSNVHFKNAYLKNAVKPYIIKEIDGERYLIIGATTSSLANLSNTSYVTVTNPIDEIKNIINKVPYDYLIILSHCGLDEDKKIAKAIPEIDLILGGHNHYFFNTPTYVNNTPIVQDGEFGARVGIIKFDKKLKHYMYKNITPELQSNKKIDEEIKQLDNHLKTVTEKIVAKTDITLIGNQYSIEHTQTNLGKLVLISMSKAFSEYDGVITNAGSIRINRNLKGNITYADVLETLPFDNNIVLVEIQGKYLKEILQQGQTTNRRYLQYYVKDKNIDDNKMYKIITNSYIASGKDGYETFKQGNVIKKSNIPPTKLLEKTLTELKIITNENLVF